MKQYSKIKIITLYSILSLCVQFLGCTYKHHSYIQYSNNSLSLEISLLEGDLDTLPDNTGILERTWISYNKWFYIIP